MKKKSISESAPARRLDRENSRTNLRDGGPARRSFSEGGFFNLRVLIGLLIALTGISLALFAANPLSRGSGPSPASPASPFALPPGFDCTKIHELGIDKMDNLRAGAIMIACGEAQGGKPSPFAGFAQFVQSLLPSPLAYGATDVDLVTGGETFPFVTQSETFTTANPDIPDQIVVAFNDSLGNNGGNNGAGASVSTDGGTTFTRVVKTNGQSPFDNVCCDPVILYHKPTTTWSAIWISDLACGGGGTGIFKSTTPWDGNSWTHSCVHSGGFDDRESADADNNPSSPFFGRMYVSWNDFAQSQQIRATFSSDGGVTWSAPVNVTNNFIRNVQLTVDKVTGDVYIAGMDEGGGGFPHQNRNLIFRSTDGGVTWTNTYTSPTSFPGPGVSSVGYFAVMFSDLGGYWRHEGWGEPAALDGVVHLVYAQQGTGGDPGDVYYIRSTDGGVTFGTPTKLNTDATSRPQWQPNLSVSPSGTLLATWYDARESASCQVGNSGVPCYRMWSRKSTDNGSTWLPDDTLSDAMSPLPGQPDPVIISIYAGDYDYGSAIATKHVTSWTDGRVSISSQSQQDAFTDREPVGGTPSPTPTATATATAAATPTATATPTVTPSVTPTPTATPTATATPTSTPRPTPTPRNHPSPRPRPTAHPRP